MIYKHVKYGTTCPKGLAAPGSRWCMSKLINAIWWGLFLVAIAVCSAWWWCKEKIKINENRID